MEEDYLQILQEKPQIICHKIVSGVQSGVPTGQWSQTHIKSAKGMAKSG